MYVSVRIQVQDPCWFNISEQDAADAAAVASAATPEGVKCFIKFKEFANNLNKN